MAYKYEKWRSKRSPWKDEPIQRRNKPIIKREPSPSSCNEQKTHQRRARDAAIDTCPGRPHPSLTHHPFGVSVSGGRRARAARRRRRSRPRAWESHSLPGHSPSTLETDPTQHRVSRPTAPRLPELSRPALLRPPTSR
jgi:hypothetical protein